MLYSWFFCSLSLIGLYKCHPKGGDFSKLDEYSDKKLSDQNYSEFIWLKGMAKSDPEGEPVPQAGASYVRVE
jgi:hypothetical protein